MKKSAPPTINVFNFSGGQTSAFMTLKYFKLGDIVIFCDTSREHPKTYKFINDFEAFENIPVTRISLFSTGDNFRQLLELKNFKILPNRTKRICTDYLKIRLAKRYLKSIGITTFNNYIGFRSDEPSRVYRHKNKALKVVNKYPLFDTGIDKQMINAYWNSKPYKLEIPSILGNCTLCFNKGANAIISILSVYPELAKPWIDDENLNKKLRSGKTSTFIQGTTYQNLLNLAQNNLFKDIDLNNLSSAYHCHCGP